MSAQCLRVSTRCPVLIEASITLENQRSYPFGHGCARQFWTCGHPRSEWSVSCMIPSWYEFIGMLGDVDDRSRHEEIID